VSAETEAKAQEKFMSTLSPRVINSSSYRIVNSVIFELRDEKN
jgi:hypothetical protein